MGITQFLSSAIKAMTQREDLPDSGPMRQAYDSGYAATGKDAVNPHPQGSPYYRAWKKGHDDKLDDEARAW